MHNNQDNGHEAFLSGKHPPGQKPQNLFVDGTGPANIQGISPV